MQRNDRGEDELRRAKCRPGRRGCEIGKNESQRRERDQHGQRCVRSLKLKDLFAVAHAACEQTQADDAVADNHDRGRRPCRAPDRPCRLRR